MSLIIKSTVTGLLLTGAFALTGCGGSSNNDQGVAFTNLGFYSTDDEGVCEEAGITTAVVGLSDLTSEGPLTFSSVGTCLGVQNNMSTQFIRTQRVRLSYWVEGAVENPPDTIVAFTNVLGPVRTEGGEGEQTGPSSSLPPGFSAPNQVIAGTVILPAEVRAWMSLNRDLLPEPPFSMVATAVVVGITSAGDQLESNPADIFVEIVPSDEVIQPSGAGAGLEEGEIVEE